jgi:hypothetical protein
MSTCTGYVPGGLSTGVAEMQFLKDVRQLIA